MDILKNSINSGISISGQIIQVFHCVVCHKDLRAPVELACRHLACRRCASQLAECTSCGRDTSKTIGWNKRHDIPDIYKNCKELINIFEKEYAQRTHDEEPNTVVEYTPQRPCNPISAPLQESELEQKKGIKADEEQTIPDLIDQNTCETNFDENSELCDIASVLPCTPTEPYPFNTQRIPDPPSLEENEFEAIHKTEPPAPLIDNQILSTWDSEEEAQTMLEGRLTQSQPLDLCINSSVQSQTVQPQPRKPAFSYISPSKPLDLRKSNHGFLAITAGEINSDSKSKSPFEEDSNTILRKIAELIDSPVVPSRNPVPVSSKLESFLPTAPQLKSSPDVMTSAKTEAERIDEKSDIVQPSPERGRHEDNFNSQFVDDDDKLLLEAEDCINLTGNKRRKEEEEMEISDDEILLPSPPKVKRLKTYWKGCNLSIGIPSNKCQAEPKLDIVEPVPEPVPAEGSDSMDSIWTPPESEFLVESNSAPKNFVFCHTRLHVPQLTKLESLCVLCNGRMTNEYSEDVTHLILNLEKDGKIAVTMKYVHAIVGKKWVITFAWVEECLLAGRLVPEEPFETSNFPKCDAGVKLSRLSATPLFQNFKFYVPRDLRKTGVRASECKEILNRLGAVTIEELPKRSERLLIIGEGASFVKKYKELYESMGWLTVTWDWVLDCILAYKLKFFSSKDVLTPGVEGIVMSQTSVPRPLLNITN